MIVRSSALASFTATTTPYITVSCSLTTPFDAESSVHAFDNPSRDVASNDALPSATTERAVVRTGVVLCAYVNEGKIVCPTSMSIVTTEKRKVRDKYIWRT